jgi:gas vesicle protein
MDENPLALVAGAAVLGLAAGLLVPESRGERRLMGPARDRLMERVEHTAARVKDAAIDAGHEVKETVREEIASRGPELKASLTDAAESLGQQVKQSAERVKEEAKQAVREQPGGRGPEGA